MGTRWARVARGWFTAALSVFVAALSHTLGGGAGPGVLALAVSFAFAGLISIGLSGRAASLWRVSGSVLASQLIFHGLFSFGGPGGQLATTTAVPAAGTHAHSGVLALVGPSSAAQSGHGPAMWLAHAVAAVVTIAALRHGGAAVHALLRAARVAVRRLADSTVASRPAAPRSTPSTAVVFTPRDLGVLLSSTPRRGPPVVTRAA